MLYDRSLCYTSMREEEGMERMSRQAASIPPLGHRSQPVSFFFRFAREDLDVLKLGKQPMMKWPG